MNKQNKRYKKIAKITVDKSVDKKEKQLKPIYKVLIVAGLFVLCIGAIVATVVLLVQKYHS